MPNLGLQRDWKQFLTYETFERVASRIVMIFIAIIIVYTLILMAIALFDQIKFSPAYIDTESLKDVFGSILSILILIEFNHSIALAISRRSGVLQARPIILITIMVIARKVILLDFWAVDCGGCVLEIPWYVEFDKKYHDKGLRLVGIDMYGESPAYIRPYMQKSRMQYLVAVGNDDIRKRFEADELPKTMLIDREGRVAVSHVGVVDKTMFEHDIQELLR